MKKLICVLLSLVMLLSLTACEAPTETSQAAAEAESETSAAPAPVEKIETIQYASIASAADMDISSKMVMAGGYIRFLGSDGSQYYACSIKPDGTNFSSLLLTLPSEEHRVNSIAFSGEYICYSALDSGKDDGTTDSWLYLLDGDGQQLLALPIDGDFGGERADTYVDGIALAQDGSIIFDTPYYIYRLSQSGNILWSQDNSQHGYTPVTSGTGQVYLYDWGSLAMVELDMDTGEPGDAVFNLYNVDSYYVGDNSSDFYTITDGKLQSLAPEQEPRDLTVPEELDSQMLYAFDGGDGSWLVARRDLSTRTVRLYLCSTVMAEPKTALTLATSSEYVDSTVKNAIAQFNFESLEYEVQLKVYTDNDLRTALTTNNMPDMILMDTSGTWENMNLSTLERMGVFQNLYDLMDSGGVSLDELMGNMVSTLEYNGQLPVISYKYQLRTIYTDKKYNAPENWTLEEFLDTALALSDSIGISNSSQSAELRDLMTMCLASFVDRTQGTCNFESELFIKLLETIKAKSPADDVDDPGLIYDNYLLNYAFSIFSLADICATIEQTEGKATVNGFPEANGAQLSFYYLLGITVGCDKPEGAWTFISQVLQSESNCSILKSNVESQLKKMRENYSPEVVDILENMVTTACTMTESFSPVPDIVVEEAAAYFAGDKTAEETAKIIQNRVSTYLAEQN